MQTLVGTSTVSGFNNSEFDNQLMMDFATTSKSSDTQQLYQKIFGNSKDVRKNILAQLEKAGMKNAMFTGRTNLQSLLALVTGEKDSSAHNSLSDVASTEVVGNESLKSGNIFDKFGSIVSKITNKKGLEFNTTDVNSEYRKIVDEVYNILLRKVQNGEVINIDNIVASYLGEAIPQQNVVKKSSAQKKKAKKPLVYSAPTKTYDGKFKSVSYEDGERKEKEIDESSFYDDDYKGIRVGTQSAYVSKDGKNIAEKAIFKIGEIPYEDLSKQYTRLEKDLEDETLSADKRTELEDKKKEIEASVVTAFCRSSEEAKEVFANNVQSTYGYEREYLARPTVDSAYIDNYPLGNRLRAIGAFKDYKYEFGLDAKDERTSPKEDEKEVQEKLRKQDINESVISTEEESSAKEYLSFVINGLKSDKGFITSLKSGSPEIIEVIKTMLSQGLSQVLDIEEENLDQYFERVVMEETSGLSDGKLEPSQRNVGKGEQFLSDKEQNNIKSNSDLIEEEKNSLGSSIQVNEIKNKAFTVIDVLKNGLYSLIEEMQQEATPIIREQLEKVKGKISELYPLNNNKEYKSSLVDEAQSFNRAASILTFADTKDAAIKNYMDESGVDLQSAQSYILGDERIKEQYGFSKKISEIFNQNGGVENIQKAWEAVAAVADKEIIEITEQLGRLSEDFYPQFLENLKNQLTPNAESVNKYYWTKEANTEENYEEQNRNIPDGLTPKQKTQRYYQEGLLLSPYLNYENENLTGLSKYEVALQNAKERLNKTDISEQESSKIKSDIVAIEELISKKKIVVTLDEQDVELQKQEVQLIETAVSRISNKDIATGQGRKSAANLYNQAMLGLTSGGMSSLDEKLKTTLGEDSFKKLTSRARKDREKQVEQGYVSSIKERDKVNRDKTVEVNPNQSQLSSIMSGGNINIKSATVNIDNASIKNISGNVGSLAKNNTQASSEYSTSQSNKDTKTTFRGFDPHYNKGTHTYYDEDGNVMMSSTEARDLLLKGKNPAFKEDTARLKDLVGSIADGEVLTPEQAGMNAKDFKFYSGVNVSGAKGDLFHHIADAIFENKASSYEDLSQKAPETFKRLEDEFKQTLSVIKKYGYNESDLTTKTDISAYLEAIKKSGLTPTQLSEIPLGVAMEGKNGKVSFGVTPDQIFSGELGAVGVDNKTGKVSGYEIIQLMAQKIATIANKGSLKNLLQNENGKVADPENMELYIADIKDGETQLIKYLSMAVDDFYNLMTRARDIKEGIADPLNEDEQREIKNYQLKGERITGTSSIEDVKSNNQSIPIFSNISDEEIKKLIKENSFSNPNDASGEIYSSRSAVRNYIKYD